MREHGVSILNAFGKYLRDKFELKRMENDMHFDSHIVEESKRIYAWKSYTIC